MFVLLFLNFLLAVNLFHLLNIESNNPTEVSYDYLEKNAKYSPYLGFNRIQLTKLSQAGIIIIIGLYFDTISMKSQRLIVVLFSII